MVFDCATLELSRHMRLKGGFLRKTMNGGNHCAEVTLSCLTLGSKPTVRNPFKVSARTCFGGSRRKELDLRHGTGNYSRPAQHHGC